MGLVNKLDEDYINGDSVNVSQLWRDIDSETPKSVEDLPVGEYSFDSRNNSKEGKYGKFYSLGADVGGKILKKEISSPWHDLIKFADIDLFKNLRNESMRYNIAEALEPGILPKGYGLVRVFDKFTEAYMPMLLARNLRNRVLNQEGLSPSDKNGKIIYDSFREKEKRMSRHLIPDESHDIEDYNAIYDWDDKEAYLIDPALWKFKGVDDRE